MALRIALAPLDLDLFARHLAAGAEPVLARLLAARAVTEDVLVALSEEAPMPAPSEIPELREICDEVTSFLAGGGRLAVHGDYDVDGVSGTAIAGLALERLGLKAAAVLPHRLRDGYGLNPQTVDRLADEGYGGILTVDCGVSSLAAARRARERGLRLWLTDHHALPGELPDAPLAHPARLPDGHPLRPLCGAGMALQLARHWLGDEAAEEFFDLAALGTIADQVELLAANRWIVQQGLRRMARSPRPGIAALLAAARHQGEIDEEAIGFLVAPRLNACGRIDTPDLALAILRADAEDAPSLAMQANALNQRRQSIEREVLDAARAQAAQGQCAFAAGEGWHRGVLGIVAARLVEETGKPAFVLGIDGEEAHGSARTPTGVPLLEALDAQAHLLAAFGGHVGAAGFRLASESVSELREGLQGYYAAHPPTPARRAVDGRLRLGEADLRGVEALSRLRPFGPGVPAPLWLVEDAEVLEDRPIGDGRHRLLRLRDASGSSQAVHWRGSPAGAAHVDVVAALEDNSFRGERSARLRVVESAPSARAVLARAAAPPPQPRSARAPKEIVDRRGAGPPSSWGEPCHFFTLDTLTVARAAEAFGEGVFPSAPGEEEELLALYESGRLRGVIGPHAAPSLPLLEVVALERPAEPLELQAATAGRRLVLAYGREQEGALERQASTWEAQDDALRDAFRIMRRMSREALSRPPEDERLALAFHVFRELGLLTDEGLQERAADLRDSRLLAAYRRRAARFRQTQALLYGPIGALRAALGVRGDAEEARSAGSLVEGDGLL